MTQPTGSLPFSCLCFGRVAVFHTPLEAELAFITPIDAPIGTPHQEGKHAHNCNLNSPINATMVSDWNRLAIWRHMQYMQQKILWYIVYTRYMQQKSSASVHPKLSLSCYTFAYGNDQPEHGSAQFKIAC